MQLYLSMIIFYHFKAHCNVNNINLVHSVFQSFQLPFFPPTQTGLISSAGIFFLFMHEYWDCPWQMSLLGRLTLCSENSNTATAARAGFPACGWKCCELRPSKRNYDSVTENNTLFYHVSTVLTFGFTIL